jgi:hypothetical protein
MVRLSDEAYDKLEEALEEALDAGEFQRAVSRVTGEEMVGFPSKLDLIAEGIQVANRRNRLKQLIERACRINDSNPLLLAWVDRWMAEYFPPDREHASVSPSTIAPGAGFGRDGAPESNPSGRSAALRSGLFPQPPDSSVAPTGPEAAHSIWERALDDVWRQIWALVVGRLGDDASEDVRRRLADEMRSRLEAAASVTAVPASSTPPAATSLSATRRSATDARSD